MEREREMIVFELSQEEKREGYWGNRYNTIQFDSMIDFFLFERERTVTISII